MLSIRRSARARTLLRVLGSAFVACATGLQLAAAQTIDVGKLGHREGDARAPIQVVEFSDFSCPYCRIFHLTTHDSLYARFVETGEAQWITVTYVSGRFLRSREAGTAAECAGEQGSYFAMRDLLYERQEEWTTLSADAARRRFADYAGDLKLAAESFARCTVSDRVRARDADVLYRWFPGDGGFTVSVRTGSVSAAARGIEAQEVVGWEVNAKGHEAAQVDPGGAGSCSTPDVTAGDFVGGAPSCAYARHRDGVPLARRHG
jgi:hypothetical protein